MNRPQVGDRVRVVDPKVFGGKLNGKCGTVVGWESRSKRGAFLVRMDDDRAPKRAGFESAIFDLYPDECDALAATEPT